MDYLWEEYREYEYQARFWEELANANPTHPQLEGLEKNRDKAIAERDRLYALVLSRRNKEKNA